MYSVILSVCLSICLYFSISIHLSICLSLSPSPSLSLFLSLSPWGPKGVSLLKTSPLCYRSPLAKTLKAPLLEGRKLDPWDTLGTLCDKISEWSNYGRGKVHGPCIFVVLLFSIDCSLSSFSDFAWLFFRFRQVNTNFFMVLFRSSRGLRLGNYSLSLHEDCHSHSSCAHKLSSNRLTLNPPDYTATKLNHSLSYCTSI